ncbi:hypothetical protein KTO58_16370 [Chitinophaga pendula]|uniref:DoxX family protein n=1 Tax=Chitinophaga TaxID=79328 RepID=UPI000BB099EC|nr:MULTISPECIES: hypothetical protein [Chitinophaga]ASZ14924.1 hypothetical protein CK934_12475 [Chitinophaga sp. MD30]UCJ05268.1 hypothetical protein KTO58_16370 [Chitinophaga pendula]
METILVLFISFILSLVISKLVTRRVQLIFSGNLAMCLMLFLTAAGHVLFAKGMTMMLPAFVPYKTAVVYVTGLLELVWGIALLFPALRLVTGYMLIIFFVLILPANIYAAMLHLNLAKGTYDGPGLGYLWFRVPLQVLFTGWVYYFSIRPYRYSVTVK